VSCQSFKLIVSLISSDVGWAYLVWGGDELVSGDFGDLISDLDVESGFSVESLLVSYILSFYQREARRGRHTVPTAVPP
jgi:hypothetical protein